MIQKMAKKIVSFSTEDYIFRKKIILRTFNANYFQICPQCFTILFDLLGTLLQSFVSQLFKKEKGIRVNCNVIGHQKCERSLKSMCCK